jgi:hypothetical protein
VTRCVPPLRAASLSPGYSTAGTLLPIRTHASHNVASIFWMSLHHHHYSFLSTPPPFPRISEVQARIKELSTEMEDMDNEDDEEDGMGAQHPSFSHVSASPPVPHGLSSFSMLPQTRCGKSTFSL